MRWRWAALVTGAVVAIGVIVVAAGSSAEPEARGWRELPPPPLSPREYPAGFWTEEEVVLVGGSDAPPCPPNASCVTPTEPPLADGAAYDPRTDSWRSIADAPVAFSWAQPVVLDSAAYLWIGGEASRPEAPSAFLAYRFEEDRWEELELPTDEPDWYTILPAGERIVAVSASDEERERPDLVFEPASATWSKLPDDPFSAGFDRVFVWDGGELLLFDHELTEDLGDDLPLRGAALNLETGVWRVLDEAEGAYARARPASGSTLRPPELPEAQGGTTEVTAGTDVFMFLGSSWPGDQDWSSPDGQLVAKAWLWSPRP